MIKRIEGFPIEDSASAGESVNAAGEVSCGFLLPSFLSDHPLKLQIWGVNLPPGDLFTLCKDL